MTDDQIASLCVYAAFGVGLLVGWVFGRHERKPRMTDAEHRERMMKMIPPPNKEIP